MLNETIWTALLSESERERLQPGAAENLPRTPDVLVIGGGIVGLAIAYFAARRGVGRVLLVERGELACGATRANAGGCFPGQQPASLPAAFRALSVASVHMYDELSQEPWADFQWSRRGSLGVNPERFPCPIADYVGQERQLGRNAQYVTGQALRELEPALAQEINEGIYCPDDGTLNPVRTALSFARAAQALGATIASGVTVESFDASGGHIRSVYTTAGDFQPRHVILATGWSAPQLGEPLRLHLPIEPAKGQMLATDAVDFELRAAVNSSQATIQLSTGQIISGGTIEYVGEDYEPTAANTEKLAAEARRVVPALREVPFVRAWTGLRPHTPDDMPILDRAPGYDNLLLAVGHFKNGVLLAPITGQIMAEWLMNGEPSLDVTNLRYGRFRS